MKVSCLQENLATALGIVSRSANARSLLPVLGNVLLQTEGDRLKLSTTDLEVIVTAYVGAKVEEQGAITLPARTLADLVKVLPQEAVNLTLDEPTQTVKVECGRVKANIKGIDAQEFPLIPQPDRENYIRVETAVFKQIVRQVAVAAATDDSRPVLTGVSTLFEGSNLNMASTDGFRLSIRNAHTLSDVTKPIDAIIPARALLEVARITSDDVDAINISLPEDINRNQIIFDMDNVVLVSQLINGDYPDYTPIIPKRKTTHTVLGTKDLLNACKRAAIFARESADTVRVHVKPRDELCPDFVVLSATSAETGDSTAQVDASIDGETIEIAFNVRYMMDVLGVIDTPQVALETTSAMEPGVIKPVGDSDFMHILMPMHFAD